MTILLPVLLIFSWLFVGIASCLTALAREFKELTVEDVVVSFTLGSIMGWFGIVILVPPRLWGKTVWRKK